MPPAASKVLNLAHDVWNRQAGDGCILRAALTGRKMTGTASARVFTQRGGTMGNDVRHWGVLVREPIDDVLSVADVDTRICRVATQQMHGPCLLDRIFIRAQISAGGILRKSFFTRKRRPVETICPQRLVLEINLRDLRALCSLVGLRRPPVSVVVPCDNSSQDETHNTQDGRLR